MKISNLMLGIVICALAAVILVGVYAGILEENAKRQCLELGYSTWQTTVFDSYCIKRVDQTDIVVPLEDLLKKGEKVE